MLDLRLQDVPPLPVVHESLRDITALGVHVVSSIFSFGALKKIDDGRYRRLDCGRRFSHTLTNFSRSTATIRIIVLHCPCRRIDVSVCGRILGVFRMNDAPESAAGDADTSLTTRALAFDEYHGPRVR